MVDLFDEPLPPVPDREFMLTGVLGVNPFNDNPDGCFALIPKADWSAHQDWHVAR